MEPLPPHVFKEPDNERLKLWSSTSLKKESLAVHVIDEVALEGLDGITLQALQVRLSGRPGMTMPITDKSMEHVWNVVRRLKGIDFYELPEPRSDLVVYRRADYVDERGNMFEPLSAPADLYKFHPIDRPNGKVRGSCPTFQTRKIIPDVENKSLRYVKKKYGNKLVLVACQRFRDQSIFGNESEGSANLTTIQYCMMERIARSRYEGEVTKGTVSLNSLNMDPKSLFYQRKYLLKKKMIKKQVFSMKFGKNRSTSLISVLHLPRFYSPQVPHTLKNARRLVEYLQQQPLMRVQSAEIKRKYGKTLYRALLTKDFENIFREEDVPLAELHPDAFAKEKRENKRQSLLKRTQKVFTYLNPPGGPEAQLPPLKENESRGGEPRRDSNLFIKGIVYNPDLHLFDSQLHQTQVMITGNKKEGVALTEISAVLHMNSLAARAGGRFAVRLKYAKTNLVEKKKTKVHKYMFVGKFSVPQKYIKRVTNGGLTTINNVHVDAAKPYNLPILTTKSKLCSLSRTAGDSSQIPLPPTAAQTDGWIVELLENANTDVTGPKVHPKKRVKKSKVVEDTSKEVSNDNSILEKSQPLSDPNREPKERYARLFLGKTDNIKEVSLAKSKKIKYQRPRIAEGLYYDEKDREALAKKSKQRVSWTAEEDQIILFLFISSVVFIPKYNLKKLFIFNAAQIRDLMHLKSLESRSKTSLAIRRRMHFLIKNPSFKSRYTYFLYDAVQDEFIQNIYKKECEEIAMESPKLFYDVPSQCILKVYDYLLKKYGGDIVQLPDHSSFKTGRSLGFSQLLPQGNVDRGTDVPDKESPGDDIKTEAITVEEIECWAHNSLKQLMVDATRDPASLGELETWICRCVVFSLMFSGDSLDDVQPFLERFGDENLEFISTNCRRLAICSISRRSHKFGLSSMMRRRLIKHLHPAMYRRADKFLQAGRQSFCALNPYVTTNTAAQLLLVEFLNDQKIDFKIELSQEYIKHMDLGSDDLMQKKKSVQKHLDDVAPVNLPNVQTKLNYKNSENLFEVSGTPGEFSNYLFSKLKVEVPPKTPDFLEMCKDNSDEMSRYARLYLVIFQAKEVGISTKLLMKMFTKTSVRKGLNILIVHQLVYFVGVTQRKVVAAKFVDPWTMSVSVEKTGLPFQKIIMYPWITSGGKVNWELIDRLFAAIIGIIYKHPGINFRQISKCLSPVISAVELTILLEILLRFNLVEGFKFDRSHQPGLTTSTTEFVRDTLVEPSFEMESLYFEAKPYVTGKYIRVQTLLLNIH